VVPAQTGRISGLEDFGDAVPRDLLRRRDQPARQALGAQLQHPLGLDLPYHQYLLLPPGARYTQRKEPKKVALITNTVGSEPVHRQERTPALNADTAGAQKTEYSNSTRPPVTASCSGAGTAALWRHRPAGCADAPPPAPGSGRRRCPSTPSAWTPPTPKRCSPRGTRWSSAAANPTRWCAS